MPRNCQASETTTATSKALRSMYDASLPKVVCSVLAWANDLATTSTTANHGTYVSTQYHLDVIILRAGD